MCTAAKVIGILFLLAMCPTSEAEAQEFGKFCGRLVTEWLPDGRTMRLEEDFCYEDPQGKVWNAPRGSIIDGASIPQSLWSLIGGPFEGNYRSASVLHDVACVTREAPWRAVHRMFYLACRAGGVSEAKAKTMFAAVYHFGPRWKEKIKLTPVAGGPELELEMELPRTLEQDEFESLRRAIEDRDLSLDEIEAYEPALPE